MYNTFQILDGHAANVIVSGALGSSDDFKHDLIVTGSCEGLMKVWMRSNDEKEFELSQNIDLKGKFPLDITLAVLPMANVPVLIAGVTDAKIRIYVFNAASMQFEETCLVQGHSDWVRAVSVSKTDQGDLLLASGSQDRCVRLWRIGTASANAEHFANMSKDQENLFSTKAIKFSVVGHDELFSIQLESVLFGHENWIHSVHLHPPVDIVTDNGDVVKKYPSKLLSSSADKSIIIWAPDSETGVWMSEMRMGDMGGTSHGVYGALWASHGKAILGLGYYGDFSVWTKEDMVDENGIYDDEDASWKPVVGATGHFGAVVDMSWDPTGTYLMTTSADQTTRIFSEWIRDGNTTWHEMARPQVHGYDLQTLCLINSTQFASGADGEKVIRLFNAPRIFVDSLSNLSRRQLETDGLSDIPLVAALPALSLSNKAVEDEDVQKELRVDIKAFTEPPLPPNLQHFTLWPEADKLYGHGDSIYTLSCSHDGSTIVSSSVGRTGGRMEDTAIRVWKRSENGAYLPGQSPIMAHNLTVTDLQFSWSDKLLLSAGRDRSWALYSINESGDFVIKYHHQKAHSRIIWGVSWSFDDKFFCTGSRDKTISIWSVESAGDCIFSKEFESAVTAVQFSPVPYHENEYLLAVGLENGNIHVLKPSDIKEWQTVSQVTGDTAHASRVNGLKWRISTSIQKAQSFQESSRFHIDESLDKNIKYELASCSDDFTARLWSI